MNQQAVDQWWWRQFRRLLDAENNGQNPQALQSRWLLLLLMASGKRARNVTFDVPPQVRHVLDDPDIRANDAAYASSQRKLAQEWIDA